MTDELLTVEQTAHRLHLQPATVRRQLRKGSLRGVKRGHVWRVPESALYSPNSGHPDESPLSVADALWQDITSGDRAKRGLAIIKLATVTEAAREIVLERSGAAAARFYASAEGIEEWDEMADWRALDGQPFHGFDDDEAGENSA